MQQILVTALSYAPGIWRRRWLVVIVAWLICILGWTAISFIPSKYESHAIVFVDTKSLLQPLLANMAVDTDPEQQIQIMQQTLVARPTMEKVAVTANLVGATASSLAIDRAIDTLKKNVAVSSSSQDNTFTIQYTAETPEQAVLVVQTMLNAFVENNFGSIRKDLDDAQTFLSGEVDRYATQLQTAQNALSDFKKANTDLLANGSSYLDRLSKAEGDVRDTTATIEDLEAKAAEYNRQLSTVPQTVSGPSLGPAAPSGIDARIQELEQRLDNLRLRYTDQHPEVANTQRILDELRAQKAAHPGSSGGGGGATSTVNEVYRQLKVELVDTQAEIASDKSVLERRKNDLEELRKLASKIPPLETQLDTLKRNADTAQHNYDELAGRLQVAKLSRSREIEATKIHFRVIDPPHLPTAPSGIKRSLLLSATLLASLLGGMVITISLVLSQATFVDSQRLGRVTGYPVLGTISYAAGHQQAAARAWQYGLFITASAALFCAYAALMLIERDIGLPALLPAIIKQKVLQTGDIALPPVSVKLAAAPVVPPEVQS